MTKPEPEFPVEITRYGFTWGPADIKRMMSGHFGMVLEVKTPRATVRLRITPSGLVRISDDPRVIK